MFLFVADVGLVFVCVSDVVLSIFGEEEEEEELAVNSINNAPAGP